MYLIEIWDIEPFPEIAKCGAGLKIGRLALNGEPGFSFNRHKEIHLPLAGIPEIVEIDPKPLLVLDMVSDSTRAGKAGSSSG